ncbi:ankyrin repeat protein [archaeon]|nr:MAG: ankyrin repeat protein [archaeon]
MKSVFFLFVVLVILTLSQINAQEYEIDAEAEDFGQFGGGGSNQRELMKEVASEQDAPIIRAASHGDLQLVTEFIRDGQPLNTQNDQGWTAVTYAVANGYTDIVREVKAYC